MTCDAGMEIALISSLVLRNEQIFCPFAFSMYAEAGIGRVFCIPLNLVTLYLGRYRLINAIEQFWNILESDQRFLGHDTAAVSQTGLIRLEM